MTWVNSNSEYSMEKHASAPSPNLMNDDIFRDPWPTYARLRAEDPVHRVPELDVWFLSRYPDIVQVLRQPDRFSKQNTRLQLNMHPTVRKYMFTLFKENPDHRRLRASVERFFTRQNLERFRSRIADIIDEAIDDLRDETEVDLVTRYAYRIPINVLCLTLGLPPGDYHLFEKWAPGIAHGMNPDPSSERWQIAGETYAAVGKYLTDLIGHMRANPPAEPTILSLLVASCEAGDIDEDELVSLAVNLYGAAHETTLNLIGLTVYSLLRFPDELEKVKRNPDLMSNAVEETVRFDGAGHMVDRHVNEDTELHGKTLKAGDTVFLGIASGNRDPECCESADRFLVDRKQPTRHLGFGHGNHFCVGRLLGRMETTMAVDALIRTFPDVALVEPAPLDYNENLFLHGLKRLPLRLAD